MSSKSWRKDHSKYLKSNKWKKKRREALDYHGAACASCGATDNLHIHHINYSHWGNEKMTDLIPLCEYHHNLVHKLIDELRETYKNTPTYNWLKASNAAIEAIKSSKYNRRPKAKKKIKKPKKLTRAQKKELKKLKRGIGCAKGSNLKYIPNK
jgi:hypothetical protein